MCDLKSMLGADRATLFIGAHNGLTAKLGAEAGFDAIWASGFEMASSLGLPDANIMSPSEAVRICRNIAESVTIPVLVDMDSGYGEHSQVYYYVKDFARAGVHGVCIEDKCFPKDNSYSRRHQKLSPLDVVRAKLRAAHLARPSERFCIVARTEAFIAGAGLPEALRRADAFAEEGADAVVIHSRRNDCSEIHAFLEAWRGNVPVLVIPTSYPDTSVREFTSMGAKGVVYANQGMRAAVAAVRATYKTILDQGRSASVEDKIASIEELFVLQGYQRLDQLDREVRREGKTK